MLTACSSVSTVDSDGAESCAKAETLLPTRRQNRSGRIIETVLSQIQSGGAIQTEWTAAYTSELGWDYTLSAIIENATLKSGDPDFQLRAETHGEWAGQRKQLARWAEEPLSCPLPMGLSPELE